MIRYFSILALLFITSPVSAKEILSEMALIETNHGYLSAAVRINSKPIPLRIILGQNADYQRLGYKFQKKAFEQAVLYYSKNDKSAAIKITNIKAIPSRFVILLKDPVSKSLYAYRIKGNSHGRYIAPIINLEKPRLENPLPHLKTFKAKQSRSAFPQNPQPLLKNNYQHTANEIHTEPSANHHQLNANKMVSLQHSEWLQFALLAAQHLKNNNITYQNDKIFLTVEYPAVLPSYQATTSGFRLASTNQNQNDGYFNWTTTNKYMVSKDDMAITEIVQEIKIDPTISNDAAIAAIWSANKDSFANENLYTLMKGTTLNIPPRFLAMEFQQNKSKLSQAIQKATGIYQSF